MAGMIGTVQRERFTVTVRRHAVRTMTNAAGDVIGHTTDFKDYTDTPVLVEIEVDRDRLLRTLGTKALASKGGRAVEAGGLVVARRVAGGVALDVDLQGLARDIGEAAARSKHGRAVEAGGAVKAKRISSGEPVRTVKP